MNLRSTFCLVCFSISSCALPSETEGPVVAQSAISTVYTAEAENYVDAFDRTPGNQGGAYRQSNVDIEASSSGGFHVGYFEVGEWLSYNLGQPTGVYTLRLRVASAVSGGRIRVSFNAVRPPVFFDVPNTGGWNSFVTLFANVPGGLYAGETLRIDAVGATNVFAGNIDKIELATQTTYRAEAENFLSALDNTPGNQGGAYRQGDVDIETTSDVGGGFHIGYFEAGESLSYDLGQPTGSYTIRLRVASAVSGGRIRVAFDSPRPPLVFDVPNTGGWNSFTTLTASVPTTVYATERIRVEGASATNQWVGNVNWIELTSN
jgi:hypothetical protein